jgi:hypothetical protein
LLILAVLGKIGQWFRLGTGAKKIQMFNLSTSATETGEVYKKYEPDSGEYKLMVRQ